jgi:hypothetical protein
MSAPTELSFSASLIFLAAVVLPITLMGWYWIEKRATARQTQVEALSGATRIGEAVAPQRLLVIRAIDDEASLILALGAILNYITVKSITLVYWIISTLALIVPILWLIVFLVTQRSPGDHPPSWWRDVAALFCSAFIIALFGALAVSRSVHGRELAKSPMECQINTQSTPDAVDLSQIVTLVWHKYIETLRHRIYEHDDCAKAISDWVRSRLGA